MIYYCFYSNNILSYCWETFLNFFCIYALPFIRDGRKYTTQYLNQKDLPKCNLTYTESLNHVKNPQENKSESLKKLSLPNNGQSITGLLIIMILLTS